MNTNLRNTLAVLVALIMGTAVLPAGAAVVVQCPGDTNQDGVIDAPDPNHPHAKCMHLAAGDGFVSMANLVPAADGSINRKSLYVFGFSEVTGTPANGPTGDGQGGVMQKANLGAHFPAPSIELKEGDEFYLTLTNAGMIMRPDLFDPHSVHFHGFPNAAPVFDGEPEAAISANMGASLTYYYNIVEPGTYMYHCHVEAAEHMQMGMLGNLYVHPVQNGTTITFKSKPYSTFVYNDGDGSTGYDVEKAIQLGSFDSVFHEEHIAVQPLPFSDMKDNYAMMNGRGYPDTVIPAPLPEPIDDTGAIANAGTVNPLGHKSQPVDSVVTATAGQKVLLRLSNLSVTNFFTVTALGLPMQVVGSGARILRGPDPDGAGALKGKDLYYDTTSVTLGGGEAADVLIDTTGIAPGTYFLYTTNLNYLSNGPEDFGGMMTEIRIN